MPQVDLPTTNGLAELEVLVWLNALDAQGRHTAGLPLPVPIPLRALIDTGAGGSCADIRDFAALGLPRTDRRDVVTASTGANPITCDVDTVSLVVPHPSGNANLDPRFDLAEVIDLDLIPTGTPVLLGVDLLARIDFHYRGPAGRFTLDY